jgi:hypothetical protein
MAKSRPHLDLIVAVGFSFSARGMSFLCSPVPDWQCWTTAARRNIYPRSMDAGSFAICPVYDSFLLATLGEGLIFRAHRKTVLVYDTVASFVLGRKSALKVLAQIRGRPMIKVTARETICLRN